MPKREQPAYEERVAEFLEPQERIEKLLVGRRASFMNMFYPFGRVNRQVLLTDRNIYVFELEGSERRTAGATPSKVLSKYQRGDAPVSYRALGSTLIVGEEQIRPISGHVRMGRGRAIAAAAGTTSETADPS